MIHHFMGAEAAEPPRNITDLIPDVEIYEKKGIRNIVFDLGGVVIDLRRENAVVALEALGMENADSLLGLYKQEEPFLGLETGRLRTCDFFETLRPLCHGASDIEITDAFCKFLIDIPVERLRRLEELRRRGYRLYVLSNTNPVMFNSWIARHFRADGKSINDYFDGIVTSFQELTCKPDVRIFQTVLQRYGLQGDATLMLDDSKANCEAARRAGMHAEIVGKDPHDGMMAITAKFL